MRRDWINHLGSGLVWQSHVMSALAPRKRVPAPMTQPELVIKSVMEQRLVLRVINLTEPGGYRRARMVGAVAAVGAVGAVGADVFVYIDRDNGGAAAEPPVQVSARGGWQYAGRYSGLFQLDLPAMPAGTPVFVVARWANRRGETGPLCRPIRVHMGGGVAFGLMNEPIRGIRRAA
jgi:hypothetical protein